MLHALGHYRSSEAELQRGNDAQIYTADAVAAVDAFRTANGMSTAGSGSQRGLVDNELVKAMWAALERNGKARRVRELLLESTAVRR
jgi:hypothetical protein